VKNFRRNRLRHLEDQKDQNLREPEAVQLLGFNLTNKLSWIFEKLAVIAREINDKYFGLDLWGIVGGLQYTIYDSTVNGHYDWHIDSLSSDGPQRKLSLVIQLSDSMDYEGGELWVHGARREVLSKNRGIVHFFPSYTLHRVTPVTSGKRHSLVGWINGPDFR
jgi:PKHD-type hydroxylase